MPLPCHLRGHTPSSHRGAHPLTLMPLPGEAFSVPLSPAELPLRQGGTQLMGALALCPVLATRDWIWAATSEAQEARHGEPGVLPPPWKGLRHWPRDKRHEALSSSPNPVWPQCLCMGCFCCLRCLSSRTWPGSQFLLFGWTQLEGDLIPQAQPPPKLLTHRPLCCPLIAGCSLCVYFSSQGALCFGHCSAPAPTTPTTGGLRLGQ